MSGVNFGDIFGVNFGENLSERIYTISKAIY